MVPRRDGILYFSTYMVHLLNDNADGVYMVHGFDCIQ